jgi:uroporphyrinogen decarboxylase
MNAKENLLRAIYYNEPMYVPRMIEDVIVSFQFEGNFMMEDWKDKWGVQWKIAREDMVPFPKGNPLPNLEHLDEYGFPDPDDLEFTDANKKFLLEVDRDSHLIYGTLTYFMFERAWALMGMNNFLKSFFTHPKEMKILLHRIADFNMRVFERYLEVGVDGFTFSEDLGHQQGLMISPKLFREFFAPEYKRCFQQLAKEGKIIDFHSCGRVQDIVEDLIDVGVTILNPVQARANNLALVKQKCMGKMALKGGVDSHLLMLGPIWNIRAEVKRVIRILAPGGGYIIGPDQFMPFPLEYIKALWTTAEQYGRYPLRIVNN